MSDKLNVPRNGTEFKIEFDDNNSLHTFIKALYRILDENCDTYNGCSRCPLNAKVRFRGLEVSMCTAVEIMRDLYFYDNDKHLWKETK